MNLKNQIELFVPAKIEKQQLAVEQLNKKTKRSFQYAAKGRYSIYHIINSFSDKKGKLLLPAYFCESVLEPITMLNLEYRFYDIDLIDLNPDVDSIAAILEEDKEIAFVLVPSMYGNPANLAEIEKLCFAKNVKMIDDGAQSFGAQVEGRYVGSFGNGGFLAFSPGKTTAAHMGSFFWTDNITYQIKRTRHALLHWLCYINFYFNREHIYFFKKFKIFAALRHYQVFNKMCKTENDKMAYFENRILGGALAPALNELNAPYASWHEHFCEAFCAEPSFRIIKACRGQAYVRKLVLLFHREDICKRLKNHLQKEGIAFFEGYTLLPGEKSGIPNTKSIINKIIELPLEDNPENMTYMLNSLKRYCSAESEEK